MLLPMLLICGFADVFPDTLVALLAMRLGSRGCASNTTTIAARRVRPACEESTPLSPQLQGQTNNINFCERSMTLNNIKQCPPVAVREDRLGQGVLYKNKSNKVNKIIFLYCTPWLGSLLYEPAGAHQTNLSKCNLGFFDKESTTISPCVVCHENLRTRRPGAARMG